MPFRTLLGTLFGMLTGVLGQEIRFYLHLTPCFGFVCATSASLDVFGGIFGSILTTLTEGSRCSRDLFAGRYLCPSIANYGLQSHVMSSGESTYVAYTIAKHILQYSTCHLLRRRNSPLDAVCTGRARSSTAEHVLSSRYTCCAHKRHPSIAVHDS